METRVCRDCQVEKPFSAFGKDKYLEFGLKKRCRACEAKIRRRRAPELREQRKKYLENNKDRREKAREATRKWSQSDRGKEKTKENRDRVRLEFTKKVFDYFGGECFICRRNEPFFEVYDGHHLDPTTKETILALLFSYNWERRVVPELEKCVLLCAICHRKLHAGWFDADIASGKLILIAGRRQ